MEAHNLQNYAVEVESVAEYIGRVTGENDIIATYGGEAVYYSLPISVDISRFKSFTKPLKESLEGLGIPDIVILRAPDPRIGSEVPQDDIDEVLALDNYHVARNFPYFCVIIKGPPRVNENLL
jgi:hypothetical protein